MRKQKSKLAGKFKKMNSVRLTRSNSKYMQEVHDIVWANGPKCTW